MPSGTNEPRIAPIGIVYTAVQTNGVDGHTMVAVCLANISDESASAVDVTFALTQPNAAIIWLRAPSAPSEVSSTQARAIIGNIPPGQRMQLEIAVWSERPLPADQPQVAVPKAYRLMTNDPILICESRGTALAANENVEAQFIIGGEVVNAEGAAQALSTRTSATGPPTPATTTVNPNFRPRTNQLTISATALLASFALAGLLTLGLMSLSALRTQRRNARR